MRAPWIATLIVGAALFVGVVWWFSGSSSRVGESAAPQAASPEDGATPIVAPGPRAKATPTIERAVEAPSTPGLTVVHDEPHEWGSVSVRATWSSSGLPAAGIALRLTHLDSPTPRVGFFDARTDVAGIAAFPRIAPGSVEIASDRGAKLQGLVETSRELVMELGLADGVELRGRTIDAGGRSVSHAELHVLQAGERCSLVAGESDNTGLFRISGVPLGSRFFARAKDRSPSHPITIDASHANQDDLRIALGERGANLVGQVVDAEERPVVGAVVCIEAADGPDRTWTQASTDAEGRFAFDGLAPGGLFLMARTARHAPSFERIELGFSTREERIVRLADGGWVSGVVHDEAGQPVANVEIALVGESDFVRVTTRTAADGSFSQRGVPHGKTEFSIRGTKLAVDVQTIGVTTWNPIVPRER